MSKKIILYSLIIVIGIVFYFSWIPDPSLKSESYLPHWLLNWSNHFYNLRTAVPFIAFGYLIQAYSFSKKSHKTVAINNTILIQNLGLAAIVAFIAECGQFMIVRRSPDLMDVYFGIIGSLVGALVYNLFNKIRLKNAK